MGITHTKVSAKSDGGDSSLVRPSDWNAAHVIELDYVEYTSPVNITATVEASADTIVTGSAVAYDGSTIVLIEYFAPYFTGVNNAARDTQIDLFDNGSVVSGLGLYSYPQNTSAQRIPVRLVRRLTPSAATHTYSIRAFNGSAGTAVAGAGPGTSGGNVVPGFIRITKV